MKRLVLLLLLAVFASGCGAAGKTGGVDTGGATGTRGELVGDEGSVSGHTASYRAGVIYCNLYPLDELARQEGVAAKPEAVARAYSKVEATPKDQEEAYKGCLASLKQK